MELKRSANDKPVELTFDEFCALVRDGEVEPTFLYRTPWSGDWRTVDNYPPFHKHSRTKYPEGAKLIAEKDLERRRQEQLREWEEQDRRERERIQDALALTPLEEHVRSSGALGAARLGLQPSFHAERFVTLAFLRERIEVQVAGTKEPIGSYLLHSTGRPSDDGLGEVSIAHPFTPDDVLRASSSVQYGDAPGIFESWATFLGYLAPLGSCQCPCLDGIGYEHSFCQAGQVTSVRWGNPSGPAHAPKLVVVRAYLDLVADAGLDHLLKRAHTYWRLP